MRGFASRLPDWLAVHEASGTIRRFVEVTERHVWDDLEGFRKAPDQEDIDERWGQPEPRAASIGPGADLPMAGWAQLQERIRNARFPIYGIRDSGQGLRLISARWSGRGGSLDHIGFTFAAHAESARAQMEVDSRFRDPRFRGPETDAERAFLAEKRSISLALANPMSQTPVEVYADMWQKRSMTLREESRIVDFQFPLAGVTRFRFDAENAVVFGMIGQSLSANLNAIFGTLTRVNGDSVLIESYEADLEDYRRALG